MSRGQKYPWQVLVAPDTGTETSEHRRRTPEEEKSSPATVKNGTVHLQNPSRDHPKVQIESKGQLTNPVQKPQPPNPPPPEVQSD